MAGYELTLSLLPRVNLGTMMPMTAKSNSTSTPSRSRAEEGSGRSVVVLMYPGCTLLDLAGPEAVFSGLPDTQVYTCWKEVGPLQTDGSLTVHANCGFEDAPRSPTVLFVPGGGAGTAALLTDDVVLDWLRARAAGAQWVTSVCSGALLLAAAGLLKGRRATSHWAVRDALALFGAVPVKERVVVDGHVMTGGGVTAGIDFGLELAARLTSEENARAIQLAMEYAPAPPFGAGTPEEAGPELTKQVFEGFQLDQAQAALLEAANRVERPAAEPLDTRSRFSNSS